MPHSVHDNVLVSYEVLSEERRIVLHTEFREVQPPERTRVVFEAVEGYRFQDDAFGNIVFAVETVPIERILSAHRGEIEESRRHAGWPWAQDLDAAPGVLRAKGVQGFELSASHGLSGWVLARTAGIVPEPVPIDAPLGGEARGIYALGAGGSRTRLEGTGLLVAFGDGRKLAVDPSRHSAGGGGVVLRSELDGPGGGHPEAYTSIVVHPAAANWMHAAVTARREHDGALVAPSAEGASSLRKSFHLVRDDGETALDAESYLLDLGEGRVLQVDPPWQNSLHDRVSFCAGPLPTQEDSARRKAGGPHISSSLAVRFGGCNVVHLDVSRPYAAHPITLPPASVES